MAHDGAKPKECRNKYNSPSLLFVAHIPVRHPLLLKEMILQTRTFEEQAPSNVLRIFLRSLALALRSGVLFCTKLHNTIGGLRVIFSMSLNPREKQMVRLIGVLLMLFVFATPAFAVKEPSRWKNAIHRFSGTASYHHGNSYLMAQLASMMYLKDGAKIKRYASEYGLQGVKVVRQAGKYLLMGTSSRFAFISVQGSGFNMKDVKRACNAGYRKAFGGRVHKGAFNLSRRFRSDVEKFLKANKSKTVVLTGHSMGGLVAVLLGAHLEHSLKRRALVIYTIGMPRVGNRTFRKKMKTPVHIVINFGDGVGFLYPSKFPPSKAWVFDNKNRLKLKRATSGLKQWGGGFSTVWKKGSDAHRVQNYQERLQKKLSSSQRRTYPDILRVK
ncbi:MAG: lipase family protein [Deltaproteobacteria bacterium]|nr:MAG: lipase family protein [Deltaproteobacteria bacterium]